MQQRQRSLQNVNTIKDNYKNTELDIYSNETLLMSHIIETVADAVTLLNMMCKNIICSYTAGNAVAMKL